jgi:hypothetical protein
MKHKLLNIMVAVSALIYAITLHTQAQIGGLKKIPGLGGGVDISADLSSITEKLTPASQLLNEAADLYAQALATKRKVATSKLEQGKLPVGPAKSVMDDISAIESAMSQQSIPLTDEQRKQCGQAHEKLIEGTAALALVAAPTALAIKKVTDSDPKGMIMRPDLAMLGILCAKDSVKLLSFTKTAADFNKKWGAPISTKTIPEKAFK